ncbi:Predicted esterase of the alpha-beta hydrolase superfamily protein [Rickettsia akari str. Hartford]|uniref:Predicted esterase of the alpha-beta hydrolase superfamily protein n=1 Tax=Rickettsia akari (strain Hartford) TaxID=293614 RepID=A8GLS3_RICAH|nr:patatin-like phospholipase family protein [Rickettsia akari]ABV74348.1 Predicted esterase of the alpha-beta hydrolase superfamily protein [Rickettsia akari str. Hartford]
MLEINNLAFAGGGVKVIAYAWALKVLKDKDCLKNIQKVVGASGGAIAAFSIVLGYQSEKIEDILKKIKFLDRTSKWDQVYNLVFYGWLNSEKYLEEFLGQLLKDNGFDPDITFKQLHDSQKTNIDLYVVILISVLNFQKLYLIKMLLMRKS